MIKNGILRMVTVATAIALFTFSMNAQSINEVIETFNAAVEQTNAGNHTDAIAGYEKCIELANALGAEGDEMKAKAEQQIPIAYYAIARESFQARDFEKAEADFVKSIEVSKQYGNDDLVEKAEKHFPAIYYRLATDAYKSQDFSTAMSYYDKALEYKPDYTAAMYYKGMIYRKQKDTDQMVATFDKVIEMGDPEKEKKVIDAARNYVRDHYVATGYSLFQAEDYAGALENFEKSYAYDAENPTPLYVSCVIYGKQGEHEKAIEYAEKALQYEDPDDVAKIYFELGNAYMAMVEYEKACEAYQNAMVEPYLSSVKHKMENVLQCE